MNYTIDQIRGWLRGWAVCDGNGEPTRKSAVDLSAMLDLLEDDQDGIEAWVRRRLYDKPEYGDKSLLEMDREQDALLRRSIISYRKAQ